MLADKNCARRGPRGRAALARDAREVELQLARGLSLFTAEGQRRIGDPRHVAEKAV
jgi:hypothetical protein